MSCVKIISGILLCVFLSACSNYYNANDSEIWKDNIGSSVKQEPLSTKEEAGSLEINGIQVCRAEITAKGDIHNYDIKYPYLKDHSNDMISNINSSIYEAAIPGDIPEFFQYKDFAAEIEIDYEIMYADDGLLSVLFAGSIASGGSYVDYKKTININLEDGTIITLEDLFTFTEIQSMVNGLTKTEACTVVEEIFNNAKGKEVIQSYCLRQFGQEETMACTDCFYIKEDTIGLIASPFPSLRQYLLVEYNIGKTPKKREG